MQIRTIQLGLFTVIALVGMFRSDGSGMADAGRPYRAYLVSAARDGVAVEAPSAPPKTNLAPLPTGWPTTFEIGQSDSPGGAQASGSAGFGFRYQYLAGGVNTGNGWATWAPGGSFVTDYIRESVDAGVVPVFSYYMVRQSFPGATGEEANGVAQNLTNPTTTKSLFDDLELFFRRAGESGAPLVVFHFEPDLWGYLQQKAGSDNAEDAAVAVASSGHAHAEGLPDDAAGLAHAIVRMRDQLSPNVVLAYHVSTWGTGIDPIYADPSSAEMLELAGRSSAFYRSLGTSFDVAFAEMSDRDAAFKQYIYGDGGASWWDEGDFRRHREYLAEFSAKSALRVVLWQIPQGNTLMRAMNNTWNHFQDNKVEWLLGDSRHTRLREYLEAGVIALLFGRGADGATCACDAAGDGITNPSPINGNNRDSSSAADDGGFFEERRKAFVDSPTIALP